MTYSEKLAVFCAGGEGRRNVCMNGARELLSGCGSARAAVWLWKREVAVTGPADKDLCVSRARIAGYGTANKGLWASERFINRQPGRFINRQFECVRR